MADLASIAREVRARAYAGYSHYTVGAAIEDEQGRVSAGCNVENVSFGATICAERAALCAMVAAGGRAIRRVAIATADGGFPCGICLQCLAEFAPAPEDVEILLVSDDGPVRRHTLAELAPRRFVSSLVREPERTAPSVPTQESP